jgi:hypothetical protein
VSLPPEWRTFKDDAAPLGPAVDQTVPVGQRDQLRAVTSADFHHGPADVGFRGGLADGQCLGDFAVAQAVGGQPGDLSFALGQLGQDFGVDLAVGRALDEPGDQAAGQAGRQQRLAAGDDSDAVQELAGIGVLDQEPAGAGVQGVDDVFVMVERGEYQHVDVGEVGCFGDAAGGLEPVDVRHADVHEHDVGLGLADQVDRGRAVGGLAHHDHAGLVVDEGAEPGAHERLVVGDEDPKRLGGAGATRHRRGHVVIMTHPGWVRRTAPGTRPGGGGRR